MLNDRAIIALADAAIQYQEKAMPHTELDMLKTRQADIQRSINNLVAAIEKGIFSESTQKRLSDLERDAKQIDAQLALEQEKLAQQLSREDIIAGLKMFQDGDVDSKEYQEALIDTFLVAAYVYDDSIRIVFNLGGKKQKEISLPFDIDTISDNVSAGDVSFNSPAVHQNFT